MLLPPPSPFASDVVLSNISNSRLIVFGFNSRIIAVNPDGSRRWTMVVSGYAVGTPVIGNDGDKIYVATNVPVSTVDSNGNTVFKDDGRVRVISNNGGTPFVTATKFSRGRTAPFGPLGIRTVTFGGKNRDLIFFAESLEKGFADDGHLHFLTPSASFDEAFGRGNDSYNLITFSEWGKSSVVRPTVSTDGVLIWLGGTGSIIAGWPDIEDMLDSVEFESSFPIEPKWEQFITPSEINPTQRK